MKKEQTQAEWETRPGRNVRFVHSRRRCMAFLVADDLRISKRSGLAKAKGGRRRKDRSHASQPGPASLAALAMMGWSVGSFLTGNYTGRQARKEPSLRNSGYLK